MFEMTGHALAIGLSGHSIGWAIASVLYPLFVVCMVLDAFQRAGVTPAVGQEPAA